MKNVKFVILTLVAVFLSVTHLYAFHSPNAIDNKLYTKDTLVLEPLASDNAYQEAKLWFLPDYQESISSDGALKSSTPNNCASFNNDGSGRTYIESPDFNLYNCSGPQSMANRVKCYYDCKCKPAVAFDTNSETCAYQCNGTCVGGVSCKPAVSVGTGEHCTLRCRGNSSICVAKECKVSVTPGAGEQCTQKCASNTNVCTEKGCKAAVSVGAGEHCSERCASNSNICTAKSCNATVSYNTTTQVCGLTCNGNCVGNVSCKSGYKNCNGSCIANSECCGGCSTGYHCSSGSCVLNCSRSCGSEYDYSNENYCLYGADSCYDTCHKTNYYKCKPNPDCSVTAKSCDYKCKTTNSCSICTECEPCPARYVYTADNCSFPNKTSGGQCGGKWDTCVAEVNYCESIDLSRGRYRFVRTCQELQDELNKDFSSDVVALAGNIDCGATTLIVTSSDRIVGSGCYNKDEKQINKTSSLTFTLPYTQSAITREEIRSSLINIAGITLNVNVTGQGSNGYPTAAAINDVRTYLERTDININFDKATNTSYAAFDGLVWLLGYNYIIDTSVNDSHSNTFYGAYASKADVGIYNDSTQTPTALNIRVKGNKSYGIFNRLPQSNRYDSHADFNIQALGNNSTGLYGTYSLGASREDEIINIEATGPAIDGWKSSVCNQSILNMRGNPTFKDSDLIWSGHDTCLVGVASGQYRLSSSWVNVTKYTGDVPPEDKFVKVDNALLLPDWNKIFNGTYYSY